MTYDQAMVAGSSVTTRDGLQASIAENLASKVRWLRFSGGLEKLFEQQTGAARSRFLVLMGFPALILMNSFLIVDYVAVNDVFALAVVLRLGVVTLGGLLVMWIVLKNPPAVIREGLQVLIITFGALTLLVLVVESESPIRQTYFYGILPILLFGMMVQRVRFWFVVPMVAAITTIYVITAKLGGATDLHQFGAHSVYTSTVIFSLISCYSLEREQRLNWLTALNEKLRSDRYEALSTVDPLTGLGNRRALNSAIANMHDTPGLAGRGVAIAIADIDHFKSYNDSYGHVAGDGCLRRVAGILTGEASKHGYSVFRFGGEEFVILLTGVDAGKAFNTCERMRRVIEDAAIPHAAAGNGALTVSIGVALEPLDDGFAADALIFKADTALYEAKGNGRNRVVFQHTPRAAERVLASGPGPLSRRPAGICLT